MYTLAGVSLGRIVLAPPERRELKRGARQRSLAAELVKRAEVILMLAAGHSYREIRQRSRSAETKARILELTRQGQIDERLIGAAIDWPKNWALASPASAE